MKRMRRIPLLMIVSLVGLLASLAFLRRESARYVPVNLPTSDLSVTRSVHDRDYTPYATLPSDVAPHESQEGVGWVFGRIIGVADAPGNGNHPPYRTAPITVRQPW